MNRPEPEPAIVLPIFCGPRATRRTGGTVTIACALLALCLGGCSRTSRDLQPGSYRATLELPGGGTAPFGLDVSREETGPVLYLVNGEERVRVAEVEATPGQLVAHMPGYENTLTATIRGDRLDGRLTLARPGDRTMQLPFHATLGETWRFYSKPLSDNADLQGRWEVLLTNDAGQATRGVADLSQRFANVAGTVLLPSSDQRYLAGEVHDDELKLSRFDGGAVIVYEARLDAQGTLRGAVWTDRGGRSTVVATRNPDASLDTAALLPRLLDPDAPFAFAFRDLAGQVVSSGDPRFEGKVLLVTLSGSWCPNSHDEAALLTDLYRRYRGRGLEVVALMFEQHSTFDRAAAAIGRYRAALGIEYPTLVAGQPDAAELAKAVPQLEGVQTYPTLVFLDRARRVRGIRTGFTGPAAGVAHQALVQDFEQTIEALLAETSPESL